MTAEKPTVISPETHLRAIETGTWSGIALVAWSVAFHLLEPGLPPIRYWTLLISVGVLILCIPSWLVGQQAKREHVASRQREV